LFVSGQIPETVAGEVPTDFPSQARVAWRNVVFDEKWLLEIEATAAA
jgi:enamine deaminase RidA (YjgF/YER057c/UK114 family)